MSIKGQQLRLHYEDFTTYIITLNWTPQPHNQETATASTLRGLHHLYIVTLNWTPQPQECLSRDSICVYTTRTSPSIYSNFKLDTTTTGMLIKGQQLRLHYEDFITYIITLNRTPQPQECLSRETATASTLRGFHHLYNNFKLDTTTGMSIKGQQMRLHYENFTTIYSNFKLDTTTTGQQLRLHYEDFTTYNNFKLDTTTTGMLIKRQQLRLHYEHFTTYIITLNWTPQPQECLSRDSNCVYTTRISPPI